MPDLIEPVEDPSKPEIVAGELALGVLSGDERAAALRRVVAEPEFAAEVDAWRLRLAPLMDGIADVPAPDTAWSGIERSIGAAAQVAVGRWRAVALGASALAAGLAGVLVLQPVPAPRVIVQPGKPQPTSPMLAQLDGEGGVTLVTAQYDAMTGRMRVRTTNMPNGELVPELWVIVGDKPPMSMGFVPINGASDYMPSEQVRRAMADGVTIAVTMEPRADAPHAAPSTPALGTAKLLAV